MHNSLLHAKAGSGRPLPYEDNEPSRSPGRLFLLSIPDLIRDPEGKRHSLFKKIVIKAKNGYWSIGAGLKPARHGSYRGSETSPKQSKDVVRYQFPIEVGKCCIQIASGGQGARNDGIGEKPIIVGDQ
jgi:hypothetical protein